LIFTKPSIPGLSHSISDSDSQEATLGGILLQIGLYMYVTRMF